MLLRGEKKKKVSPTFLCSLDISPIVGNTVLPHNYKMSGSNFLDGLFMSRETE